VVLSSPDSPSVAADPHQLPAGAHNYHAFAFLNALAFLLTAGPVATLFAKSLAASATSLGLLTALIPTATLLQLPGARLITRFGYKRLFYWGFGARAAISALLALLPWAAAAHGWSLAAELTIFFAALVAWHTVRCLANVAYFPWMADLAPEGQRGRFLAHNNIGMHLGEICSTAVAWAILAGSGASTRFGWIFLLSAAMGWASLAILHGVPGGGRPIQHVAGHTSDPVGLGEMLACAPFRRLLVFNALQASLFAGWATFTIAFMKDSLHLGDGRVVAANLSMPAGALVSLFLTGRFLDATSGRKVVRGALALFVLVFGAWGLVAGGLFRWSMPGLATLWFASGFAWGIFNTSNTRVFIGAVPLRGRNHYLAVLVVATSAIAGIAPVASGQLLDALVSLDRVWLRFHANQYSIYFGSLAALALITLMSAGLLPEKGRPLHTLDRRGFALGFALRRIFRK
jgi:MFS family permease